MTQRSDPGDPGAAAGRTRSPARPEKGPDPVSDEAEDLVWSAYRAELFRFARSRVRDDAAAEDIVQDVLARAYRERPGLRSAGSFQAWLYRITRNAIVDHYRARRPTEEIPHDLASQEPADPGAVRAELARCILPLMERLPAHYRTAVTLTEIEGLTQQEAAERMQISLSGAKSRIQRARARLREMLLQCCRVEFDSRGAPVDYVPRERACGSAADSAPCGVPRPPATAEGERTAPRIDATSAIR